MCEGKTRDKKGDHNETKNQNKFEYRSVAKIIFYLCRKDEECQSCGESHFLLFAAVIVPEMGQRVRILISEIQ